MNGGRPLNVKVPSHQLDTYDEEAEKMGFPTRSAYVRAMINAGRREFGIDSQGEENGEVSIEGFIEERILAVLREADGAKRDEVITEVAGEIEQTVTDRLEQLDTEGRIDYDVQDDGLVVRGGD